MKVAKKGVCRYRSVLMRSAVTLCTATALVSCSEALLEIRLVHVAEDHPYDGVAELRVLASNGGEVLARHRVAFDGGAAELEGVPREEGMTIEVAGLSASGETISSGVAAPNLPERAGACCVAICFCTLAVRDQGACSCGSNDCLPTCQP